IATARNYPVPARLIRYQLTNHLGSATLELDDEAQIIFYEEYTPYGSSSYEAVRNQLETPKRYRYTGKERDEESGLYYHGARYFASWLARWINGDPLFIEGGINVFAFSANRPIIFIDKEGTQPQPYDISKIDISEKDTDLDASYSAGNFDFEYKGGSEATVTFRTFVDFSRAKFSKADEQKFLTRLNNAINNWDQSAVIRIRDTRSTESIDILLRFKIQLVT